MIKLPEMFYSIQKWLFPELEEELGELTAKQKEFIRAIEVANPSSYVDSYKWKGIGAKPYDRESLLRAFIAKPIFQCKATRVLIDMIQGNSTLRRLCGWESKSDMPSESVFSRTFKAFANDNLADKVHEGMIDTNCKEKLIGHVSKDSTAVKGREKSCRKNSHGKKVSRKRGRPRKGEEVKKEPRRLELQPNRTLEENLEELPKDCDWGTKKDSNGKTYTWKGYKLHLDCADGGIPISAIVTSASVHDSQAGIPLMQMTNQRVTNLYDVMDSAYDAPEIHSFSKQLNHVPIIDNNPRRGEKKEFDPAKKIRYNERTTAERANSELKDNYCLENIFVKGYEKVKCHMMFAVIALTAKTLYNMTV